MSAPIGMYTLTNAHLLQDGIDEIIIASDKASWMPPVLGGIGLAVLGFLMFITGEMVFILFGILAFSGAFYLLNNLPYSGKAAINFVKQEIVFTTRYVLRAPRLIHFSAPLGDLVIAGIRGGQRPNPGVIDMVFRNGTRLAFDFGRRTSDAAYSMKRLKELKLPMPAEADQINAAARAAFFAPQVVMQQRLRTWSVWMFIMAVIQLVSGGGFNPWVILLIVVGAASFYFRVASMFIMYAVIIGWAGVSNLLFSDAVMWKGFAILQAYWAYQLVTEFRRYHRIEKIASTHPEIEEHTDLNQQTARAGKWFPWIALAAGILSIGLFGLTIITIVGGAFLGGISSTISGILGNTQMAALLLSLLGLSAGAAGWASGYPNKIASVIGTIASILTLIAMIALILLGR